MWSFDHVIIAIPLPASDDHGELYSILHHERLGTLLLFDPTDDSTTFGYLPPSLQANTGLLVANTGGELMRLPLLAASCNRVFREATLHLDKEGTLEGEVREIRRGPMADQLRQELQAAPNNEKQKVLEKLLNELLNDAVLTSAKIGDLNLRDGSVVVQYSFRKYLYGQRAGSLLLFRPSALGQQASTMLEGKPRKLPLSIAFTSSEGDIVDFTFPPEYKLDELPKSAKFEYPFATYRSDTSLNGNSVHYSRNIEYREIAVPLERLGDMKEFYRKIAADENSHVILSAASGK